ncbi:MAG: tetratricopeptide repeat protein, partial [Ignavibacteria bacterium]|nr:tetratricopeptide repeat protein [Ignavibacteria bacterium]
KLIKLSSTLNEIKTEQEIEGAIDLINFFESLLTFCKSNLQQVKYLSYLEDIGAECIKFGEMSLAQNTFDYLIKECSENKKLSSLLAKAYLKKAIIDRKQAKWLSAEKELNQAKVLFSKLKDTHGLIQVENVKGNINAERGKLKLAKKYYESALKISSRTKYRIWQGLIEMNLGIVSSMQCNWDDAYSHYKRALTILERENDFTRLAEIRHNMGMLFGLRGEFDSALVEFDRSLEYSYAINHLSLIGLAYLGKGLMYSKTNDNKLALEYCNKAMEIFYQCMDRLSLADVYKVKGMIQRGLSNFEIAESYLLTSLRINEELDNPLNYAETSLELALLYKKWKKSQLAVKYLKFAKSFFEKVGAKANLDHVDNLMKNF